MKAQECQPGALEECGRSKGSGVKLEKESAQKFARWCTLIIIIIIIIISAAAAAATHPMSQ